MLDYFSKKRAKRAAPTATEEPVLTEEDELFLQRITSEAEGPAPDLPPRPQQLPVAGESSTNDQQLVLAGDSDWTPSSPKDAQTQLMHGAHRCSTTHIARGKRDPATGREPGGRGRWEGEGEG